MNWFSPTIFLRKVFSRDQVFVFNALKPIPIVMSWGHFWDDLTRIYVPFYGIIENPYFF